MKHLNDFLRHDVTQTQPSLSVHRRLTVGGTTLKHIAFLLLFILGSLNVWADDSKVDITSLGTQTWTSYSLTSGVVTISTNLNNGNAPTTSNAQYRWKTNNIITISLSEGTIKSIQFKTNSSETYGPKCLSYNSAAITSTGTDYTWTAPTNSLTSASFTVTSEARLTEIHVIYTTSSGGGQGGGDSENLFEFDGGKDDIANTAGISQSGLSTDYSSSPKLKFDGTGDYVIVQVSSAPGKLSYDIVGNNFSGGTFSVLASADGYSYSTTITTYTSLGSKISEEYDLASSIRYIKFIYTSKSSGNVALGNIVVTAGSGGGPSQPTV